MDSEYYQEETNVLRDRLEQGINIIEMLQHPPSAESKKAELANRLNIDLPKELDDILCDMVMALSGKEKE